MFMPELSSDQYLALGKFVYQFVNLERWVNLGILEAESLVDSKQIKIVLMSKLVNRIERLERALGKCEEQRIITMGQNFTPKIDFEAVRRLSRCRNSLVHGEPRTLIDFGEPVDGEYADAKIIHVNENMAHGNAVILDVSTLDSMQKEVVSLASALSILVTNLALAKQGRGEAATCIRTIPLPFR